MLAFCCICTPTDANFANKLGRKYRLELGFQNSESVDSRLLH